MREDKVAGVEFVAVFWPRTIFVIYFRRVAAQPVWEIELDPLCLCSPNESHFMHQS